MTFTSFKFFVFLPLVIGFYYALPHRFRRAFLLAASIYFLACFKPEYTIVLVISTLIDFFLGLRIQATTHPGKKKFLFLTGLLLDISTLIAFKYLDFLNEILGTFLHQLNIFYEIKPLEILLPVGISYYTFKKISYLIDVYRGTYPAEKKFYTFALYVSFFPTLMAGPIDRAGKLLPQFHQPISFDYQKVTDGLKLIAWGFFKKVVIADRLAVFVDKVYNHPDIYDGPSLVVATIYFSFQVYCDFSGYTDIVIGIGKVLGFDLMENFNRPYFARSIGEFWKRWHISLSSWLMDYLFLPISYAVSRRIKGPRFLYIKAEVWAYITGIILTFFLCGLWHGASWTFVLWGLLHGFYLALSFLTRKTRKKIVKKIKIKKIPAFHHAFQVLVTFVFVSFSWIFFRANSVTDIFQVIKRLFSGWSSILNLNGLMEALTFGLEKKKLAVAIISIVFLLIIQVRREDKTFVNYINQQKNIVRWSFYILLLVWLMTFGEPEVEGFIYFRF